MGVYLELFHGRKSRFRSMDDWGATGPVFGPFDFVHNTYHSDLKFNGDYFLSIVNDLVYYDGLYYGDWSVFDHEVFDKSTELQQRLVVFDHTKAVKPGVTRARGALKMTTS